MILTHFSEKPFRFNSRRIYSQLGDFKPRGLWLSDESDYGWKEWCRQAHFRSEGFHHTKLFHCDTSRWIVLRTISDMMDFDTKYKENEYTIDWPRVRTDAAGILISPYHWPLRHKMSWYYSWDCASACVWDLSTIKTIRSKPNDVHA